MIRTRLIAAAFCAMTTLPTVVSAAGPEAAAAAPAARARTDALIAAFKKVARPAEGGALSAEQRKTNEQAFAELDTYFNQDRLVGDTIAPFKDQFSPAQLERFKTSFWKTLRLITYTDSGAFFQKAKLTFQPPQVKGDGEAATALVSMTAYIAEDDAETDVALHWAGTPKGLQLVDTSFDGASLVKDYQNQFGRIIKKEGVEALIEKLEQRYAKVSAQKGMTP